MAPVKRIAVVVLFAALAVMRFGQWGAPPTQDEVDTFNFATLPIQEIYSTYGGNNHHLLFNMLLRIIDQASPLRLIESTSGLAPLQFPSILASIGALIMLFFVARRFFGEDVALLAVAALGVSYWHLKYSHMLRAYSLATFVNLLCVWLLQLWLDRRNWWPLPALALGLAVSHGLVLTDAYYTIGLLPWIAVAWDKKRSPEFAEALGGVFAATAIMTWLLFRPTLGPFLEMVRENQVSYSEVFFGMRARVAEFLAVVGYSPLYRLYLVTVAAAGAALLAADEERRPGLAYCIGAIATPFLISTYQRVPIFARLFIGTLPAWSMLFAVGAAALLKRTRAPLAVGIVAVLVLGSGEAYAYLSWDRGLDPRPAIREVARLAREQDDLAMILPPKEDSGLRGDYPMPWEYAAMLVNFRTFEKSADQADFPYLARKHYYAIATSEEQAHRMLDASRVDPFMQKTFRPRGTFGKLTIYSVDRDASVIAQYKAAAADRRAPAAERAQALTGLGADATARGEPAAAVAPLVKAKALFPNDPKIRFQLAMAHYLAFQDVQAIPEFEWVVAHDTANVHAPFYLGDLLLLDGRWEDSLHWFWWYIPGPPKAWFFNARAKTALQAAFKKPPKGSIWATGEQGWFDRFGLFYSRGAYERADAALARAIKVEPAHAALYQYRANMQSSLSNYHACYVYAMMALDRGAGYDAKLLAARALEIKFRLDEARRLTKEMLARNPDNQKARDLLEELDRLPDL